MIRWIGQHIFDWISRFRNDVYMEKIPTNTEPTILTIEPDGKIGKKEDLTQSGSGTIHVDNLSTDGTPLDGEALIYRSGSAVWCSPESLQLQVRNDEGTTLPVGTPVYSKGEIGGSLRIKVGKADASDPAKMPAIGITTSELDTSANKDGFIRVSGVYNTNISGFTGLSINDNLYVASGGGLTQTHPAGEGNLIQNMGIVLKTNGTTCQGLKVSSIDRTNATPNLDQNAIFLGDATNKAVATDLSNVNISLLNNDAGYTSGDNLGNHTATQILHMSGYCIDDVGCIKGAGLLSESTTGDHTVKAEDDVILHVDSNNSGASGVKVLNGTATQVALIDEAGNLEINGILTTKDDKIRGSAGTDKIILNASDISVNTHKISNVVDPTTAQDAATKNYVDEKKDILWSGSYQAQTGGSTTNWIGPGINGVNYYYWSKSQGDPATEVKRYDQAGFSIPFNCEVVGIEGSMRTQSADTTNATFYLYHYDLAVGSEAHPAATLVTSQNVTSLATNKYQRISIDLSASPVSLTKGELLHPFFKLGNGTASWLKGTLTIIIKHKA